VISSIPQRSVIYKAKMGKRSRKEAEASDEKVNVPSTGEKSLLVNDKAVDPSLALLFASSVG